jgi:hypothetical protein
MICPHLRFAAYLVAKKLPLDQFIKGLPVPDIKDVSRKFPNVSMKTTWLVAAGVRPLRQQHPEAEIAYMMWQNPEIRAFLMVAILMKENPIDTLNDHYRIPVTDYTMQLFTSIFMDFSSADLVDVKEYSELLTGVDRNVLDLFLNKKTWTYIQDTLNIRPQINHDDLLKSMFMKAYKQFEETGDLGFAKLALSIQKELRDVKAVAKKDAIQGVTARLKDFDAQSSFVTLAQLRESSSSTAPLFPEENLS